MILRGQGDTPLAAVIQFSSSPKKMWQALEERYSSSTTFYRGQVFSELSRKQYEDQGMDEFVGEWELTDTKLKAIGAVLDECTLTNTFFESFGAGSNKFFANVITALQTRDTCTWKDATARMIQEYCSRTVIRKSTVTRSEDRYENALNTYEKKRSFQNSFSGPDNKRRRRSQFYTGRCFYCVQEGHTQFHCRTN